MQGELKPCPLCGHVEYVRVLAYAGNTFEPDEPRWNAGCPRCTCSVDGMTKSEAITAWNTRTGKLIVVDHPQATSPVDDRGVAVCEQQAVEAVARAMAPSVFLPFEGKLHGSPVNRANAQSWWLKNAQAAIAAMPGLAARDVEIARLREALEAIKSNSEASLCLNCQQNAYDARQALGDEA